MKQMVKKQFGGTILGFILGLIIGLGIAVVVALAINKGATPFTNKLGKSEKPAEPTAGQISDPNKPLHGNKEAAKEAAKAFAKEPIGSTKPADGDTEVAKVDPKPANPANPPEAKVENKPDNKAEVKPDVKTAVVDKAAADKAKKPESTAKPEALDEKWIYYLQAGAFRENTDAENTRAKLALLGFEAAISERVGDNGVLYRVRIGPYSQVEAMNRVRSKLNENGVDVAVIRNQK